MNEPGRLLLEIMIVAIAVGGLAYGSHWKRAHERSEGVSDRQISGIFEKVDQLEKHNIELLKQIQTMEKRMESAGEK